MSTKKQLKQIATRTYTREEAEAAMRDLCIASCKLDARTAKMNEQLARIREDFEADISSLSETAELLKAKVLAWADKNPKEFAKKKSVEMVHGVVGYRTAPFSVRLIRGVTWDKAIALIEAAHPELIRNKKEADKEGLIASRDIITKEEFTALGIRIDQDEKPFVEVKKDTVDLA